MKMTSIATSNGGGKRRKCSDEPRLLDLPEALLAHVGQYLPGATNALLVTTVLPPSLRSSPTSRAILSSSRPRGVLDFGVLERDRAAKFTDHDVAEILSTFAMANDLRALKLAGCANVTGEGLGLLRWCSALEQIDLSVLGHDGGRGGEPPASKLSPDVVVPILDSIIVRNDSSVRHIQLPKKWREERSELVRGFLERFTAFLDGRRLVCTGTICTRGNRRRLLRNMRGHPLISDGINFPAWVGYGVQTRTCYQCLKSLCVRCFQDGEVSMQFCTCCSKVFCSECEFVYNCERCRTTSCGKCNMLERCDGCLTDKQTIRAFCAEHPLHRCDVCNLTFCFDGDIGEDCCAKKVEPWVCETTGITIHAEINHVLQCDGADCKKQICNNCMPGLPQEETIVSCVVCERYSCRDCLVKRGGGCGECRAALGIEADA